MDTDLPYDMAPDYFDSDEEKEFSRLDEHYRKTNPNKIYFYSTNLEQNEEDYDPIIHRACNPDTVCFYYRFHKEKHYLHGFS